MLRCQNRVLWPGEDGRPRKPCGSRAWSRRAELRMRRLCSSPEPCGSRAWRRQCRRRRNGSRSQSAPLLDLLASRRSRTAGRLSASAVRAAGDQIRGGTVGQADIVLMRVKEVGTVSMGEQRRCELVARKSSGFKTMASSGTPEMARAARSSRWRWLSWVGERTTRAPVGGRGGDVNSFSP